MNAETKSGIDLGPRRYRRYREYKDSGAEWLAEIPEHWKVKRLKFVAAEPIKNGIGEAGAYDNPEWPRYVRITDIAGPRDLRDDTFKSLPPDLAREAPFKVGDLLLAAVGATFGKSYLHARNSGPVCFAGYMVRFSPSREVESSFAAYWTESSAYWSLVQSRVVQATIQNFSAAKYKDLAIPLPTLAEQRAIAAFLDRETARIDELLAKKERLIKLLQEQRTALITRAVTKGLDPSVPMKDSGVEWLGEIPVRWEVKRLKRLVQFQGGGTPAKDNLDYWKGEIPWVSPKDMKVAVIVDTEDKITSDAIRESATKLIPANSVLIVVRSGILAHSVPVALAGCELTLNQDLKAMIPGAELVPEYLVYLIAGMQRELLVEWKKEGATVESLELELIAGTPTLVPTMDEQRAIAAFLNRETARLDTLVNKIREAIDRLKELRTALITAAVTGKIDVREEAA